MLVRNQHMTLTITKYPHLRQKSSLWNTHERMNEGTIVANYSKVSYKFNVLPARENSVKLTFRCVIAFSQDFEFVKTFFSLMYLIPLSFLYAFSVCIDCI